MLTEAPTLRGDRVLIGPLRDDDAQAIVDAQDAAWLDAFDADHAWTIEEARAAIRGANRQWSEAVSRDRRFAIRLAESGVFLGEVLTRALDAWNRRVTIEIRLTPSARCKGYAQEAVELAASFAITEMEASGVVAHVKPSNDRSINLFERLGFRRDGTFQRGGHDVIRFRR